MKKFFKILGILILVIILLIVLVLGYLGFVPGVSALMGTNKPRDLGVKYTEKELNSAQGKLGQKIIENSGSASEKFKSGEGHPVDTVLTQEEYSAHAQQIHPVSDLQIKLNGSAFEISGKINRSRIPQFVRTWGIADASDSEILDVINKYMPTDPIFYIAGTGGVKNDDLSVNLTKAELGRLPVSTDQAREVLEIYTETLFQQVGGFSVEDSGVRDGKLYFKGSAVEALPKY